MNKTVKLVGKKPAVRKTVCTWQNSAYLLAPVNHICIINRLYLGEKFEGCCTAQKEIQKKLNSYKQQDIKKDRFNGTQFINIDSLLEKLVISRLKCYYCRRGMLLLYKNKRDVSQWTLDRIDNTIGHTGDNVVIACLECNIARRCRDDEKFLYSKQMRIIKKG